MYLRNRRHHQRKNLQADGWIAAPQGDTGDTWLGIKMLDISQGGFAFVSENPLVIDAIHRFRFHLPDSSRLMHFDGRISHSEENVYPAGYRIGVEFKKIDVADLATIEWIVAH